MNKFKMLVPVLIVAMLLPLSGVCAWENTAPDDYAGAQNILTVLGVLTKDKNGTIDDTKAVTNAQLADYICRLSGQSAGTKGINGSFRDVTAKTEYSASIYMLLDMNLIERGDYYNPEATATCLQAVRMILYLMGYRRMVEDDGTENGCMRIAGQIGMTRNIAAYAKTEMNLRLLTSLMFNALDCNILGISQEKITSAPAETLLECNFGVLKTKGIVTANEITALTSSAGESKGYVRIGSEEYLDPNGYGKKCLGMEMLAYYKQGGENSIIYAVATARNSIMRVNADDINKAASGVRSFAYYDEKSQKKKIDISVEADVLYNGVAYPEFKQSDLYPAYGYVQFIDNNNDAKADVVLVNEIENYVVDTIDIKNKKIYDKYGNTLDLEKADSYEITSMYGASVGLEQLGAWNVLSVKASKNLKFVSATVYIDTVKGEIEKTWQDGGFFVTVDGDTFAVADSYLSIMRNDPEKAPELKNGKYGVFYLDAMEKIAAVAFETDYAWQYGYMTDAKENMQDGNIFLRMAFEYNTLKLYACAKNVKIDGYLYKNYIEAYNRLFTDKYGQPTAAITPRLIKFCMNGDGEIEKIDTPYQSDRENDENLQLVSDNAALQYSQRTGRFGIGESMWLKATPTTIVYHVPTEDFENPDRYSYDVGFTADNNERVTFDAYDTDFAGNINVMVIYGDEESDELVEYGSTAIISAVKDTVDKDNAPVKEITGYSAYSNQTFTYAVDEDENINSLSRGDIITYKLDFKNQMKDILVHFKTDDTGYTMSKKIFNSPGDYSDTYTANAQSYLIANILIEKKGQDIKVLAPDRDITDSVVKQAKNKDLLIYSLLDAVVYVYNSGTKAVSRISPLELEQYAYGRDSEARVLLFTTYTQLKAIFIYR